MQSKKIIRMAVIVPAILLSTVALYSYKHKATSFDNGIKKVNHVVVIYMENHSFDNLYGQFSGADGISNASKENIIQLDANGQPYSTLPQLNGGAIPNGLPNDNFDIEQYVHADKETSDVTHEYYREQNQINGGKMNKFV